MKLILACLALIGPASAALATEAAYRCADGTAVRAIFSAPGPSGSVRLTVAGKGRTFTLPQTPSADGGRYADSAMEFWIKGRTARLTRSGVTTECKTR
ncbi:MliC family protein [Bradyrhizobium sp. ORS 86]|uniref:MliC family protein n=1 Tax=Bradyrhizobium sp. ORS 86 TaxID=1685970 RepID=UPI00388DEC14